MIITITIIIIIIIIIIITVTLLEKTKRAVLIIYHSIHIINAIIIIIILLIIISSYTVASLLAEASVSRERQTIAITDVKQTWMEDSVPGRGDMELEGRLCARKYKLKQAEVATVRLGLPIKKENEIK